MKILFFLLLSTACLAQQPLAEVTIHKLWNNRKDIVPTHGMVYDYRIGDDTARYFHPVNDKNFRARVIFYDEAIGLPDEPIGEETITIIDSTPDDPANKYYGTWRHASGSSWLSSFHDQTGSYNTGTADSLVITVDGYKVEWYTEKLNNHGIAEVRIDGKFAAGIDLYKAGTENNSQLVWTGLMLTDGPHKITIRYTGQKNEAATQANIIHDYLKVFKK